MTAGGRRTYERASQNKESHKHVHMFCTIFFSCLKEGPTLKFIKTVVLRVLDSGFKRNEN
jgi:hypothetical protein